MKISIVSPVYKGEKMLGELVSRVETAVKTITEDFEIILVNDCSPDDSWTKMKEICATDKKVKGINLSRNFGQHYAITAGLTASTGEWVVVMDCDLQDRPEEIPNLYHKAQEGYDTVFGELVERNDKFLRKFTSRVYSYVFAFFTDLPVYKKYSNYGIYHRKVIEAVLSMGDNVKCFPLEVRWVGFKIGYYPIVKDARGEGTSSYTWAKLMALAFDVILAFSNKPLKMALRLGFCIVVFSILLAIFYLIRYMAGGIAVSGFTTLIISLWLIAGMLISLIGMVGIYLGRVYDKVKDRPVFIVKEQINFEP